MSPNLSYNRGRALEYKVRDYYKGRGFEVFRTAGSRTKADLICIEKHNPIILVQCKTASKLMTKKERKDFDDYCFSIGCVGMIAYRNEKRKVVVVEAQL